MKTICFETHTKTGPQTMRIAFQEEALLFPKPFVNIFSNGVLMGINLVVEKHQDNTLLPCAINREEFHIRTQTDTRQVEARNLDALIQSFPQPQQQSFKDGLLEQTASAIPFL